MYKKNNPHCPQCGDKRTRKKGSQNGRKRYWCTACRRSFSIDHRRKDLALWIPHVDGVPIRKLADERGLSPARVYQRIRQEMNELPESNWLTTTYCTRFCGLLVVDGKYVKVRGYAQKIPWLYGMDYLTHDIVVSLLAPSENEEAFLKLFRLVKTAGYPLQVVVCDDRSSLVPALKYHYPRAKIQLCQNHYVENIRTLLRVRTEPTHRVFFATLVNRVFKSNVSLQIRNLRLHELLVRFAQRDTVRQTIILDIFKRRRELFAYQHIARCPQTTNLIELFNSHLNARLKSIKGFKSWRGAERFLNAYTIRRRTKAFTDCRGTFKHLNGKTSLQLTLKNPAEWPEEVKKALESKR